MSRVLNYMLWYAFYYLVVSTRFFFEIIVKYIYIYTVYEIDIFTTLTDQHHHMACPTKNHCQPPQKKQKNSNTWFHNISPFHCLPAESTTEKGSRRSPSFQGE